MLLKQSQPRSGSVAALVALLLVALCACICFAIEGGMMASESRHAQAVADAAAMAGAVQLYRNYKTTAGIDPTSVTKALEMAADNGYKNDANGGTNPDTTQVLAYNPPITGSYVGQANYVEVTVTYYQNRYFSWVLNMWPINANLTPTIPLKARAVAEGAWVPSHNGVLLLANSGSSLQSVGNATLNINGGDFIIDSTSSAALFQTGNAKVVVQNGNVDITGNDTAAQSSAGPIGSSASIQTSGSVYINQHPTPDPLAYLPAPGSGLPGAPPIPPKAPDPKLVTLPSGQQAWICYPGTYGVNPGSDAQLPPAGNGTLIVFMQANNSLQGSTSGIYYIEGGGFTYNNTSLVMDNPLNIVNSGGTSWYGAGVPGIPACYQGSTGGMMIYVGPYGGGINLQGNPGGLVYLQPLTSPSPYSGMIFWQDRSNSTTVQVAGNGSFTIGGTMYAQTALLKVTGNGGTYTGSNGQQIAGSQIGSQYVTADMQLGGNGTVIVNYQGPPKQPVRILTLVE
jgi:Flp pilus assembly protein TadG